MYLVCLICINNNVNIISFVDVSVILFIDVNVISFDDVSVVLFIDVNVISVVDVSVIPFIDINKTMFSDGKVIPCINNKLIMCTNPIIFIMHFVHHNHALNHITYYVHRAALSGINNGNVRN